MSDNKSIPLYKGIIFWTLFFIAAVLPFLFSTQTFNLVVIKNVFFQLGVTFLFFVWLLKLSDSEFIKLPKNPVILPFFLFLIYAFFSAANSLYHYTGFEAFVFVFSYFLLFVLVIETVEKRFYIRLLSQNILIVAGLLCFFSLYISISRLKLDFWKGALFFDFFGNPNFFAAYLIAVLPISFSFFFYSHKKFEKFALFLLSILISFTLLLTYSQAAWLILLFYFLIFYIGITIKYWHRKKWLKGFSFALFPFLVILVFYIWTIYSKIPLEKYLFPKSISLFVRQDIWRNTWGMIKIFPFLGWGIGRFHLYFPLFQTPESLYLITSPIIFHAHNEFLQLTAEMGFFGLSLFLWIIFGFLLYGFRSWLRAPLAWKKYLLSYVLGATGILMNNLICPSLRYPGVAFFFWLMVGLAVSADSISSKPEGFIILKNRLFPIFKLVNKGLLFALAIVLFFPLSLQIIRPYPAEVSFKKGMNALDEGNLPQAIMKFEGAKEINPRFFSAYYKLGHCYRMLGEYHEALENYLALKHIAPNYARLHYNLGCVYKDLGRFQNAIDEFKIALKQEDEFFPHYRLKEIYFELGEKALEEKENQAIKRLEKKERFKIILDRKLF